MNTRKIIATILEVVFGIVIFVGVPIIFIFLNNYFGLSVFSNIFLKIIGTVLTVGGLGIVTYSALLHMKTGRTTWLPVIDQPKKFIVSGFYKYCRNPMYLTETLIYLGIFFVMGQISLLVLPIIFFIKVHLLVVFFEEPGMRKKFGEEYVKYTKSVPRWIPRLKP